MVALIAGTGEQPDQGFFVASNPPAVGRRTGNAYIYAIQTDIRFNDGDIEITKDDREPRYVYDAGFILGEGRQWGCYVNIGVPNHYPGSRFGLYEAKFTPFSFPTFPVVTGHTFLKQRNTCPEGMYDNSGTCMSGVSCLNGGVLRDKSNDCICPPYFSEFTCQCAVVPRENGDQFVLGDTRTDGNNELTCSDLPGGNANCKGMLICYGDLYGCKCAPGWHGDGCDRGKLSC
ncbi:Tyrosine-protein kinase receptor Tie-2 [Holothuria leucospilota]|uniref:Tyrosine-protein kinase receptor Tie-2 n=1 Tax=Holothuria leucospilota TaxID=206669 RepID=A0A9Q1HLW0_HOLLE|nr:Tyrosine-protein kinase receptor Tie-2 [Holothuria leucospilota]